MANILIAAYAAAILALTVAFVVMAADQHIQSGCDSFTEEEYDD